jgi:hypothetical protein
VIIDTVLILHHTGKVGKSPRGGSALFNGADTGVLMERKGDSVTATCTRQKNAALFPPITLRLVPVADSCVLEPGEQTEKATPKLLRLPTPAGPQVAALVKTVNRAQAPINRPELARRVGVTVNTLKPLLARAIEAGGVVRVGRGFYGPVRMVA